MKVKKYDEVVQIKHISRGWTCDVRGWTYEELYDYIGNRLSDFVVYVQCRDCGNIHSMASDCQVCDKKSHLKQCDLWLKG